MGRSLCRPVDLKKRCYSVLRRSHESLERGWVRESVDSSERMSPFSLNIHQLAGQCSSYSKCGSWSSRVKRRSSPLPSLNSSGPSSYTSL